MEETRFWILAAKKVSGELTAEENGELELLLLSNSNYRDILLSLETPVSQNVDAASFNERELLQRLRTKLAAASPDYPVSTIDRGEISPHRSATVRSKILLAASLLIIISFFSWKFFFDKQPVKVVADRSTNNISTKPGSKTQVKLPDGTIVTLNADSKLSYPDNFLGNTREVNLEGEAFFEVAHDTEKPFIVHTKMMDIRVLGTVFNVRSYADDNVSEASLLKGSIQVTLKNRKGEKIMLVPNEKISVSNIIPTEKKDAVPTDKPDVSTVPSIAVGEINYDVKDKIVNEVAWMQNKLVFNDEHFDKVVLMLERWYGKQIEIRDQRLKDQRFTGKFKNETIEQVLRALQLSYNFRYKMENNIIVIY